MKNRILVIIVLLISISVYSQKKKKLFYGWKYYSENFDYGFSMGLSSKTPNNTNTYRTYVVRSEFSFIGLAYLMAPESSIDGGRTNVENKVNGLNVSFGSDKDIDSNGLSVAVFGQYLQKMNGLAISSMGNSVDEQNGISVSLILNQMYEGIGISAALGNETYYYKGLQVGGSNIIKEKGFGLQIGVYNESSDYRGIQLGLWNRNGRRSLPFVNWQFSKKKTKSKES